MSDKRKRFRQKKGQPEEQIRPVVLAKREDDRSKFNTKFNQTSNPRLSNPFRQAPNTEKQRKILVKLERVDARDDEQAGASVDAAIGVQQGSIKTMFITRSEALQSPASAASPTTTTEQHAAASAVPLVEPVPLMTRPATVISSNGTVNINAKKVLKGSNTDFFVVGIIGTQGVGKSTVLNLIANEDPNYDYYTKVFVEEESIFPTKLKMQKCAARSRTESTHMFITQDRMILLDSPPVLCNSFKKDMTSSELDDLHNVINFLTVCHLVIVVSDDYINLNFLRLLNLAALLKPPQDMKAYASNYFPNIMFVKNRAKRIDFMPHGIQSREKLLKAFFKNSPFRIYLGEMTEKQRLKKSRAPDTERKLNSFLLPDVQGPDATHYHDSLQDIIDELRMLVIMTPRNEMSEDDGPLTEAQWFDLLMNVSQNTQHFFLSTYEDIHRQHYEVPVINNTVIISHSGHSKSKETHDNWRDQPNANTYKN